MNWHVLNTMYRRFFSRTSFVFIGIFVVPLLLHADKPKATSQPASLSASKKTVKLPGPFPIPKTLPKSPRVVIAELHDEVSLGMASYVERVTRSLRANDLFIVDINTFGGRVDAAVRIRDALLNLKNKQVSTVAYIHPRAISAGALISLATDVIAVSPGATIGAATPIEIGSDGETKSVGEKVVSYMRQEMRSTAEAKGRNGTIAEAMVDADIEIDGLIDRGKLLTLDGKKALAWSIASVEAETLPDLYRALGYGDSQLSADRITITRWSWSEKIAGWLSSAQVSALLMTIGMVGLMIGLYTGGSPIPLAVGASCLLLFFFGHYITNLAGTEDLILFLSGVVLIIVEAFIPGFGLIGISGIVLILLSFILGLVDLETVPFHVQWETGWISTVLTTVSGSLVATLVLTLILARFLPQSFIGRAVALNTSLASGDAANESRAETAELIGKTGIVSTPLFPSGKIEIDGKHYDAIAEHGFIEVGKTVNVTRRQGFQLVVIETKSSTT